MRNGDDPVLRAIYSIDRTLERIAHAIWFGVAMLVCILLTLAYPEWRGIFG